MTWREKAFGPMRQRTLENAQIRLLSTQYDLGHESRLASAIVREVNGAVDTEERLRGVLRVRPGEMLLRTHRGIVLFPLRTQENLDRFIGGESIALVRRDIIHECLTRYRALYPKASDANIEALMRALKVGHGGGHTAKNGRSLNVPRHQRPYGAVRPEVFRDLLDDADREAQGQEMPAIRPGHRPETLARLRHYLGSEAGVPPAVREPLVMDLLRLRARFCPRVTAVRSGQMPLVSMHVDSGRSLHQPTRLQPLAPVLVSVLVPGELKQLRAKQRWDHAELRELHARRMARVMVEAYQQNGLLSYAELQWCFHTSMTTVSLLLDWFQRSHHVVLPCPGSVLDMGRMMTHKDIIVRLYLEGMSVLEISRQTYHAPRSVDAYLRAFDAVLILHLYGLTTDLIARVLGHGPSLIEEYLMLIGDHLTAVDQMRTYLINRGVRLPAAIAGADPPPEHNVSNTG